jgi:hypothetical protein
VQVGKGLVSRTDLVTDIVPDMAGTSLDGATVAHVVDNAPDKLGHITTRENIE